MRAPQKLLFYFFFFFDLHTTWYTPPGRHLKKNFFFFNRQFITLGGFYFSVSENVTILGKGLSFYNSGGQRLCAKFYKPPTNLSALEGQ